MQLLWRYLFTTAEGLSMLAFFTCTPVVFTLLSTSTIKSIHVKVNGVLALVFAVPAAVALRQVEPDSGMAGFVFVLVGVGAGGLALSFLVATLATGAVLAFRGRVPSGTRSRRPPPQPRGPSRPPLRDEFDRWKRDQRRPMATYREFLDEAHPRYFPMSARSWVAAAILMAVVAFLVLR